MIPFAILQGRIEYESGKRLEIRILELAVDYVTFRVPVEYEGEGKVAGVSLDYYVQGQNRFEHVKIDKFEVDETDRDRFAIYYRLSCSEEAFAKMSQEVTKEYLRYVELKLEGDDAKMSHEMTGGRYPKKEEISAGNIRRVARAWCEKNIEIPKEKERFLWLKNRNRSRKFVENGIEAAAACSEFIDSEMAAQLAKSIKYTGVAIGSVGCEELFPNENCMQAVIKRAGAEGLSVLVEVPPVSELRIDEFKTKISETINVAKEAGSKAKVYIQFNDLGMYSWADRMFGRCSLAPITIEKGVLLYKNRRDPRRKYMQDSFVEMHSDNTLWGPFYQTNTGTFCPLHALVCNKDRGKNERVKNCARYCEQYLLEYPDHLAMVGFENSLWGFNEEFLVIGSGAEASAGLRKAGRVVINL